MKATNIRNLITCLAFVFSTNVFAQSPLIVNMQVLPPYSPVLADYMAFDGTSVITITNTTATNYDIKLAVHLTGDNGIEAYTNPGFMPSLPITVAPFATRVVYGSELQFYNDVEYTVIGADVQALAINGIVPDGYYTLCVQALDYFSNAELSADEPSGCIPINIQYLDAPFLISPICGDSINKTYPQNIIFNWITPPGAPLNTQYHFKMVEVIPFNRNPYDAMATATTPSLFETTTTLPLLVYGPAQPPLEIDHTYAWQVTATDPSGNLFFQNDGKSEVCSFIYKNGYINYINNDSILPVINYPESDSNYIVLNGNMQYYYESENSTTVTPDKMGGTVNHVLYPFKNEPVSLVVKYMLKINGGNEVIYLPWNTTGVALPDNDAVLDNSTTSATGDFSLKILRSAFPDFGLVQQGVTVTIPDGDAIEHYFNDEGVSGGIVIPGFGFGFGNEPEDGFDYGIIEDNNFDFGNVNDGIGYHFNDPNYNFSQKTIGTPEGETGLGKPTIPTLDKPNTTPLSYSDEIYGTFTGDLYRVVQVYHNNAYYCMPVESFQPLDTGSMYVGTLETRVRDYILNVDLTQIGEGGTVNFINNDPDNYITLDGGFDNDFMFFDAEYLYMDDDNDDGIYTTPGEWELDESVLASTAPLYRYSIYRETRSDDAPETEGMNLGNSFDDSDNLYFSEDDLPDYEIGIMGEDDDDNVGVYEDGTPAFDFELQDEIIGLEPKDYGAGRVLISRTESKNGTASFNKLLKSLSDDDYYILVVEPVDENFINPAIEVRFLYDYDDYSKVDKALYNAQYTTPEVELDNTENTILSGTAVVEGQLNFKYDDPAITSGFPLKNITITLQRLQYVIGDDGIKYYSTIRKDLATTTTNAEGHYLFNYSDTAHYGLLTLDGMVTYGWGCSELPEYAPDDNPIPDFNDQINEFDNNIIIKERGPNAGDMPSNFSTRSFGGTPGPCVASGALYQELAIVVESGYYTSPATHFTILPAQHKTVAPLTCYVKAYDLELTLIADPDVDVQYKVPGDALRDMLIVLVRNNKPQDVPENEVIVNKPVDGAMVAKLINNAKNLGLYTDYSLSVENVDENDGGYEFVNMYEYIGSGMSIDAEDIVGIGTASAYTFGGDDTPVQITFKNLVKNIGSGDEYQIIAIPDYENSDINYIVPLHTFKSDFTLQNTTHPYGNVTIFGEPSTNTEGVYPKMKMHYVIEASPLNPVIFGKVLRSDNGYPLYDVKVQLKKSTTVGGVINIVEVETTTAADGSYYLIPTAEQYNSSSVQLFSRAITFTKFGYDDNTVSLFPTKKGKISNRVADTLQPGVLVSGYIYLDAWDETLNNYPAVPATVQIGNGPMVHTVCVDQEFNLDGEFLDGYMEQQIPFDPGIFMGDIYEDIYDPLFYDPGTFHFQNDVINGIDNTEILFGGKTLDLGDTEGLATYSLDVNADVDDGFVIVKPGFEFTEAETETCELAYYATFASRGTWLSQIHPDEMVYLSSDTYSYIPDSNVYRLDFLVYENMHRLRFTVKDEVGNYVNANIEVVGVTDKTSIGVDGKKDITFKNAATDFHVIISGPDNSNFVQEELFITNEPSPTFTSYTITLDKGVNISGKVTQSGTNSVGARVYVDAAGLEHLEAYTGAAGTYTIYGVPKGSTYTVRAVKEASGLIGDYESVSTSIAGNVISNINFELTTYAAMDLTKLVGFDTEIETITTIAGVTRISGALVNIPENDNFSVSSSTELPFTSVAIKASTTLNKAGVPYAEPLYITFTISNAEKLPITVLENYDAYVGLTTGGLIVEKVNTTSGKIKSVVKIDETNFNDPTFSIEGLDDNGFYLENTGTGFEEVGADKIILFASGIAEDPDNTYYEIGIPAFSSSLSYKLHGIEAYCTDNKSNRIYADSLVLDTWIDPTIYHTDGFATALNIGKIKVMPDYTSSKSGFTKITINMDKWNITSSNWEINNEGFTMKSGVLDASGVSFAFTDIKILDGDLIFETSAALGTTTVSLIDILEMDIENTPDFIYNGFNWQVYVGGTPDNPAASIENLPGLPSNNNDLTLQLLLFESDAAAEFKMNNNSFELFQVTTFTTEEGAMYVHSDEGNKYITLPGIIDLNLPSISVQPTAYVITNDNGNIATSLEAFGFGMEVNGIVADFNAGDIQFLPNGLIVEGEVSEDPYFSHQVKLYHVTDSTAINTIANQKFQYTSSGQNLQNLFGRMYPLTNSWTNYQFTGDVTGASQVKGRWTFTVYGEITAENQKVDVSNLKMEGSEAMDFDNMGMSFDFANKRLVGSITIDESMPGGGSIAGQANILFDDDGWYFVCGGQVTMPSNPYLNNVSLALLFGDYPIQNETPIKEIFTEYSYDGALPPAFADVIAGFYIDGKVEMPIPYVPNFEIDFVVVSAEFDAGITAGFQLGMNFTEELNTYYTGLMASIHIHAGVGASVVFGCAGVDLDYFVGIELKGQYQSNGEWFTSAEATAAITASAYAGAGLACDSNCEGACAMEEWSGTASVQLKGEVSYQDGSNYHDIGIESVTIE